MAEALHHLAIAARDRPGTIESIAAAFSTRGISLVAFSAVNRSTPAQPCPHNVALSFHASEQRRHQMVRLLRRMKCVEEVDVVEAPAEP